MTQDTPSRSLDKVIVRLPDGMRDRIREAAENNNRSMNAEIVSRLEASFGMDIPLVQGTVNTVQGFQAIAQQLVTLTQNPQFQAFIKGIDQPSSKEIEHLPKDEKQPSSPTKADE
ncbi:Arc family DNA-binding protein [Pseudochrobactrum asaccharolyticum]|uniref:Arc-like DNA binding dprotein n=1 Tax=Pseudochrobactrum asaccharolyticum TaxID=354351 RepID=A0A366DHV7_9HYPH|nr:Arc family DNA-binding protein [Pseudochrobactrum asaccharolyticum]RBO89670.1 Arc-like DNA binding dprotein [Pseudochrobactrum asaccharolyticum]